MRHSRVTITVVDGIYEIRTTYDEEVIRAWSIDDVGEALRGVLEPQEHKHASLRTLATAVVDGAASVQVSKLVDGVHVQSQELRCMWAGPTYLWAAALTQVIVAARLGGAKEEMPDCDRDAPYRFVNDTDYSDPEEPIDPDVEGISVELCADDQLDISEEAQSWERSSAPLPKPPRDDHGC
jgi:hypothetical protein